MLTALRPRVPRFVVAAARGLLILGMAIALGLLPLGGDAALAGGDATHESGVECGWLTDF